MNETAYILNTATERSLVIMDEVGRGTGTKDGLSIAWAVCEDLLDRIRCRTLFATHYHELSLIVHPRLANRSMEVVDKDGEILFLRRVKEGPSAESYGLHVARLAGLSDTVLDRAQVIMGRLRDRGENLSDNLAAALAVQRQAETPAGPAPAGGREPYAGARRDDNARLDPESRKILGSLRSLDINSTTPLDALNLISGWKRILSPESRLPPAPKPRRAALSGEDLPSLFD
jgi:DNA mismatch repair protein MutS